MSPTETSGGTARRSFLKFATASGAAVVLSAVPGAGWAAPGRNGKGKAAREVSTPKVYVLVVDGCRPDEVTTALTPNLAALRDAGTNFPAARSLPIMETLPNHVMMMTGLRPDRTGVPANSVYDPAEGAVRTLNRPTDLRAVTVLERLNAAGFTTGTVLSKEYLYGIFGARATYRWEPAPIVPVSGHAPDAYTVDALIGMVDSADPDLVFTNLGDVDRMGHSDLTGTTLQAARHAALASTDLQVGRFIEHLKVRGTWQSSVVIVLADHSMDWSLPTNVISIDNSLWLYPELRRNLQIAQNGGADLLYWTGDAASRDDAVARLAMVVAAHPGVLSVHRPAELRLGPEAGDLVVYCRAGWRFSDPYILSNPIPGNHGHPATEPIPFFIGGGSDLVLPGVSSEPARTVDVAPTVAALFGLDEPKGGYDGRQRTASLSLAR